MIAKFHKLDTLLSKVLSPQKKEQKSVYVPSQFTFSFEYADKHYVFHTLTKQCVESELPEQCYAGEKYDDLIEGYFLVPAGKDECIFYQSLSTMLRTYAHKKGESGYTILPTLACNARCTYCYEEGMEQTTMTPETVEQTIRYILATHGGGTVKLAWFGGEPLLCESVIDQISEALRVAVVPYKSFIVSNGSLITPDVIEKMTGLWKTDRVQISMDGAERDYIARKRYIKPRSQYHDVIRAIDQMTTSNIHVRIRCNLDEINLPGLSDLLEDLQTVITHKEKIFLCLSPLFESRASENDLLIWKKLIDAQSLVKQAGFQTENMLAPKYSFSINHCTADGNGVVIAPDGSLYSCEHCPPESKFGDIWHGVTDEAARREFSRTDRVREKCRKCPFLPDCTAFSSCPIQDKHCREVREMMALDSLKRLVQNHEKEEAADGEVPAC